MTERDYINVRDLSNVRHAIQILGDIAIKNQPNIKELEFLVLMGILMRWSDDISKQIKTVE